MEADMRNLWYHILGMFHLFTRSIDWNGPPVVR
jgi:hypothetical protein